MTPGYRDPIALLLAQRQAQQQLAGQQQQPGPLGSPFAPRPMMQPAPVMGTPPRPQQQQEPNAFQNSYNAVTNAMAPDVAPQTTPYQGQGLKALFARLFGNKDSEGGAAP